MTPGPADVVVVGAGHNGLVAAAYLARAGLRVTVIERRDVVGGAAVTEEIAPGFRSSTASYAFSSFRPEIFADLGLGPRVRVVAKDPQQFVPLPDGRSLRIWRDAARTRSEIEALDPRDGDGYDRWARFWDRAVRALRPVWDGPPLTLDEIRERVPDDVWELAVSGSAAGTVERFFRSDAVQGVMASQGIIGTRASVRDPGTAWVMAYHALGGELVGADGTWGYVVGGMGALTHALADVAAEAGAEIVCGRGVARVLTDDGVRGVELTDGTVVRAATVVSNADPATTFLGLLDDGVLEPGFAERVRSWPTPGSVVKVNLALRELPGFVAAPGRGPHHEGTTTIAPSLRYLHDAFALADQRMSPEPFMEVFCQSAVDPSLVDGDGHVLSVFAQYAPARGWDPDAALDTVLATLAVYAPNVPSAVIAAQVLGPPELEERFALPGGNIFHGELLPERCFAGRFDHRTPVPGLYLCGAGSRPGGCVMGAPGRDAATVVLRDRAR